MKTHTDKNGDGPPSGRKTDAAENGQNASCQKVTRRQRMFIRRALRLEAKAKTLFGKMRESIALAMQNGLQIDQPVEIEVIGADGKPAKKFVRIKNNFAGDVAFKRSYVSHYELEDVPKYQWPGAPPKKQQNASPARTVASNPVEAGVSPAQQTA
jgi:hypothetical protein